MIDANQHIIHKLSIEVDTDQYDRRSGQALTEKISEWLHDDLIPSLEEWLDQLGLAGQVVRLDKLKVAINANNQLDWPIIQQQIFEQLESVLKETITENNPDVVTAFGRNTNSFIYYLRHGLLPWWEQRTSIQLKNEIVQLFKTNPTELMLALQAIRSNENAIRRLAFFLPKEWILKEAEITDDKVWQQTVSAFDRVTRIFGIDQIKWAKDFWQAYLISTNKRKPDQIVAATLQYWLEQQKITQISDQAAFQEHEIQVMKQYFAMLEQQKITQVSDQATFQEHEIQVVKQYFATLVQQIWQSFTAEEKRMWKEKIKKQLGTQIPQKRNRKKQLNIESSKEDNFWETLNLQELQNVLEVLNENKGKETVLNPTPNNKQAITDYELQERAEEGLFITNAGLVLLHPFLQKFFQQVDYLSGQHSFDESKKLRASYLLQYLVMGDEQPGEEELLLNKLFLGIPLEIPIPPVHLSAIEKEEAKALLETVVEFWEKLGNTSTESLQRTFLQRNGKLTQKANGWHLEVEKQGFDILLDSLPWGFGTIKLPWMKQLLFVEWNI